MTRVLVRLTLALAIIASGALGPAGPGLHVRTGATKAGHYAPAGNAVDVFRSPAKAGPHVHTSAAKAGHYTPAGNGAYDAFEGPAKAGPHARTSATRAGHYTRAGNAAYDAFRGPAKTGPHVHTSAAKAGHYAPTGNAAYDAFEGPAEAGPHVHANATKAGHYTPTGNAVDAFRGPAKAGLHVRTGATRAGHYALTGNAAYDAFSGYARHRLNLRRAIDFSASELAQQEEPTSPRAAAPVTFLQLNDVYSAIPIDGLGGLARVATIRQKIAAAGKTPLLLLAGDFLSPSVASSIFKGEQMVAALNAAGLDLATLGNHEFDFGVDILLQRMAEAKWQWVVSNVIDTNTGKPLGNAAPYVVRTFGPLKIGFIGLCLTSEQIAPDSLKRLRLIDPMEAAATYLPILKSEGANMVVAITHLSFDEDRALAQRFPEIDVIIGGHEHYPITATEDRTLITKAGSDAKFVARIDVNRRADGMVERFFELMPVTGAIPDEPRTAEIVNEFESRLGTELNVVVGTTRVGLDADSARMRAGETNLGNLVADAMRMEADADVAIVNSGSIRGDRVYPTGPLTRRTIVAIQPFGNVVCKMAVPGRIVLSALNSGVARLPASEGRFPQISGMTMRVDPSAPAGSRVRDVTIGGQPIDLEKIYTVATTDYQLKGGDGYDMFIGQRMLVGPDSGPLVATALEKYVAARGEVNPTIEGRIAVGR